MSLARYFFILLLTVISFFGISLMIIDAGAVLFIKQVYLMFFLLIMAGIALFSAGRGNNSGWMLFVLFFGVIIFDSVYLFETSARGKILLLAVIVPSFIGFFISISGIRPQHARRARTHPVQPMPEEKEKEPSEELEVVSIPAKKKAAANGETARKKAEKKKTGKTRKKTAKKRPRKKASRGKAA